MKRTALTALALLASTAVLPLWADDITNVIQQRNNILRLRYNEDMSRATTPAQRQAVSDAYKDRWSDNLNPNTGGFGGAGERFDNALHGGDSSFADSLKKTRPESEVSGTLQPTLNYYEPGPVNTTPAGSY